MQRTTFAKTLIILAHAFVGWALCGAIMGVGPLLMPMQTTLIVHLIAAPIIFAAISYFYFTKFAFTTPLQTALIFVGFVIFTDFLLVGVIIIGSLEMFSSPIGTWIPFILIFASTYLTGTLVTRQTRTAAPA